MTDHDHAVVILLVEENAMDVELTLDAFRQVRFPNRIEVARNGRQALDYLFGEGPLTDHGRYPLPNLGLADGLALSSPTVHWMTDVGPGLTQIADPFRQSRLGARERLGCGAFEFRLGDGALRAARDEVLRTHVGSPQPLALIAEFGLTPVELPGSLASPGTSPR